MAECGGAVQKRYDYRMTVTATRGSRQERMQKMYIPEFWCGVAATIITEVIIAIAYSIYADHKKGGKK